MLKFAGGITGVWSLQHVAAPCVARHRIRALEAVHCATRPARLNTNNASRVKSFRRPGEHSDAGASPSRVSLKVTSIEPKAL